MYEIFEKLCAKKGITPYRFCKDMKVNSSTISTWKTKGSLVGPELAKKICEYFGVSLDYLMGNSYITEMGRVLKEERIAQKLSSENLASSAKVSVSDLNFYEEEGAPIREDIFEDMLAVLGMSSFEMKDKYGLHDQHIPYYYDGNIDQFEKFKKARRMNQEEDSARHHDEITAKNETERRLLLLARKAGDVSEDERDAILNNFESTIDMYLRAKGIKKEK